MTIAFMQYNGIIKKLRIGNKQTCQFGKLGQCPFRLSR